MNNTNSIYRVCAIDSDTFQEINKFKKALFKECPTLSWRQVKEEIFNHFVTDLGYPFKVVNEAYKLVSCNSQRRVRCLDKTTSIVQNNKTTYFGTLTFNNETLEKTTEKTDKKDDNTPYFLNFKPEIADVYKEIAQKIVEKAEEIAISETELPIFWTKYVQELIP